MCWSVHDVGGRPSPAPSVKVSEPWMKLCRSDESLGLTANFHQSSCGRGGLSGRMPGGLLLLWGFPTTYQAYWLSVGRHGPAVCLESPSSVKSCISLLTPVCEAIVKAEQQSNWQPQCAVTCSVLKRHCEIHMPAFVPLCSGFALVPLLFPFASILNMVCIDLFSSTN